MTAKKLTSVNAKAIFALLGTGIDAGTIHSRHGHRDEYTGQVITEAARLQSEIIKAIKSNSKISEEAMLKKISSELLNVSEVLDEIIKTNPSIRSTRTFNEFKTEVASE